MKFIRLEILNLASLDKQDGEVINFTEGALGDSTIFSIVGPTGSGKSTILDAICLALYGLAPRYIKETGKKGQKIAIYGKPDDGEKNRLAPTDCRNILTRGKKEGYSKLTFLANNDCTYRAEWHVKFKSLNYDKAKTYLYKITRAKDGTLQEEIAEWTELPVIIGLDYEQFLRTVLIAQGSFANFLTEKEDDRYALLEKLIGSEELYSRIVEEIKAKRDEAAAAFNAINADYNSYVKDIIAENELKELKDKIQQLDREDKKTRKELNKVINDLKWYSEEEKFAKNIKGFEEAYDAAKSNLDAQQDTASRLALHDSTQPAVALYKDIKDSEKNIAKEQVDIANLQGSISQAEEEIKKEQKSLKELQAKEIIASDKLKGMKPHIDKARTIKGELASAESALTEKENAMKKAEAASISADKGVENNKNAISKAKQALENEKTEFETLQTDIEKEKKSIAGDVEKKQSEFNAENDKLKALDAQKLQDAKTYADRNLDDLNEAIRILDEIKEKQKRINGNNSEINALTERNKEIDTHLKSLGTNKLQSEIKTLVKSHTLMTSENWEEHRHDLADGQPCPLCGSTEHPYNKDENFTPVVNELKKLIDEKSALLEELEKTNKLLTKEQGENTGKISALSGNNKTLGTELDRLHSKWDALHAKHEDWQEDADNLGNIRPEIENEAAKASAALREYNELSIKVNKLRETKETAESAQQEHQKRSSEKLQEEAIKVTLLETDLKTEQGKTENLLIQQTEKSKSLTETISSLTSAEEEVAKKKAAINTEIGDKDPDVLDKELNDAKEDASNAVSNKNEDINKLNSLKKGLEGQLTATKTALETEQKKFTERTNSLAAWLKEYNSDKSDNLLTVESIALLYSAKDNWEEIRKQLSRLKVEFTSTKTTLENEKNAHTEHMNNNVPAETQDWLAARKTELENVSTDELTNCKARLQLHNTSVQKMGALYDEHKLAEEKAQDWKEICDAIGGDGKTLRKIAQCYTLRFLIEHANAEIRKFNSRYELQQVKNSLGIRVIDHDRADDVREITSLSGGETFIVSLGLALGLSSLSSRNISFENLFIDEGFGSLDPETLDTIIDSLSILQTSQGKKVGVISHTDAMSERIATQIRVIKNGNSGSSHIEIYP